MRKIWVHLLLQCGKTEWVQIPWGKKHLDAVRRKGAIINYHE